MFPSPYGVIFILTGVMKMLNVKNIRVSVSLWSYIHSYLIVFQSLILPILLRFRLLTELYSFLLN